MSAVKLAPLFLFSGPVFIGLGVIYSQLEWAVSGGLLVVLGMILALTWRRQAAEGQPQTPRSHPEGHQI